MSRGACFFFFQKAARQAAERARCKGSRRPGHALRRAARPGAARYRPLGGLRQGGDAAPPSVFVRPKRVYFLFPRPQSTRGRLPPPTHLQDADRAHGVGLARRYEDQDFAVVVRRVVVGLDGLVQGHVLLREDDHFWFFFFFLLSRLPSLDAARAHRRRGQRPRTRPASAAARRQWLTNGSVPRPPVLAAGHTGATRGRALSGEACRAASSGKKNERCAEINWHTRAAA